MSQSHTRIKSVNVAIGLTVGAATSTSTFIGQGSLELTRSDGASHIDFKNAFADDFDSRIITNAANQLQLRTDQNDSVILYHSGNEKFRTTNF